MDECQCREETGRPEAAEGIKKQDPVARLVADDPVPSTESPSPTVGRVRRDPAAVPPLMRSGLVVGH
jgi:hypothetical protein